MAKVVAGAPEIVSNPQSEPPPGTTVIPTYALYTPGQVSLATFFGSPLAGGWVMATNERRLGRRSRSTWTLIGTFLGTLVLLGVAITVMSAGGSFLGLISVFVMHAIAKATQGELVESHLARGGRHASSWAAFGLGLLGLLVVVVVAFGAGIGYVFLSQPDDIKFGASNVIYDAGGTKEEAQAVGTALTQIHYFGTTASTVEVRTDGDRRVVEFVVKDTVFGDRHMQAVYHGMSNALANALGGAVDVWLDDDELATHVKLRWEDRPRVIDVGDGQSVIGREGGTEAEARAVAGVLTSRGYFGHGPSTVVVQRAGDRHVVAFFVADHVFGDAEMQQGFLAYARELSAQAFANEPVDIWFNDAQGTTRIRTAWEQLPAE
jgi:hypothetical protein